MKNEKSYLVIIFTLLFMSIVLLFGLGIQTSRLEHTGQQLDYYRTELESAQNRQQQLTSTIDGCFRDVTRAGEILSQSVGTISDVRKQISEIRENYEIMEDRLLHFYDIYNTTDISIGDRKESK